MRRPTRARAAVFAVVTLSIVLLTGCGAVEDPLQAYLDDGFPIVETLTPSAGIVGTKVTIAGQGFGDTQELGAVKVYCAADGGAVNAAIESWSATAVEFRIPPSTALDARVVVEMVNAAGLTCPYPVYVTIESGTSGS